MLIQLTGYSFPKLDYFYVKDAMNVNGFFSASLEPSAAVGLKANYQFILRYQSTQLYLWNSYS